MNRSLTLFFSSQIDEPNSLTELLGLADQVKSLNQANEDKQLKLNEQAEKIAALNEELAKLRAVVLAGRKAEIAPKRAIVSFECSIGDMAAFLESGGKRKSQFFFFHNLAWSIEVSKTTKKIPGATSEATDYLSVFVCADNLDDSPGSWVANATDARYRVTLINQRSDDQNCSFACPERKFSYRSNCYGCKDLITMKKLRNGHFIEEDQIKFRVLLYAPASSSRWDFFFSLLGTASGKMRNL